MGRTKCCGGIVKCKTWLGLCYWLRSWRCLGCCCIGMGTGKSWVKQYTEYDHTMEGRHMQISCVDVCEGPVMSYWKSMQALDLVFKVFCIALSWLKSLHQSLLDCLHNELWWSCCALKQVGQCCQNTGPIIWCFVDRHHFHLCSRWECF